METIDPTISATVTAIWRHRILAFLVASLTFLTAVAAYLATTPTFESSASLLIRQDQLAENGSTFIPIEVMNSQVRIAESDEVIRAAIERVGLDRIHPSELGLIGGLGGRLRAMVKEWLAPEVANDGVLEGPRSPLERAATKIHSAMDARVEPNSSVLTISVSDESATFSADMANALAESFIDRQNALMKRPGLVEFLESQTRRFDKEVAVRSATMEQFMSGQHVFSIEEQRTLLLKRLSDLNTAIAETRGRLADKEGQKQALSRQLALLRPVARSPFTLGFVQSLEESEPSGSETPSLPEIGYEETPPLLLIKVFQEAMANYRILDSEIGGLRHLVEEQSQEAVAISSELGRITDLQGEYERLKREKELAVFNADTFARRTVEEQIESDLRDAKLSNVRVIQPAARPARAAAPKGILYAAFGLLLGATLGAATALAKEMYDLNRRRTWQS